MHSFRNGGMKNDNGTSDGAARGLFHSSQIMTQASRSRFFSYACEASQKHREASSRDG